MLSVVILAAGFGTRMKSKEPKILHKICGKSMIEYVIETALQVSSDIHIVLYNQENKIKEYIQNCYEWFILDKITFHTQLHNKYPGTGGALMLEDKSLIDLKGNKVVVLSGDTPLIIREDIEQLINGKGEVNIGVFKTKNPHGYGRIIKEEKDSKHEQSYKICNIIEDKDCTPQQRNIKYVNAGIYCFNKDILQSYISMIDNSNAQEEYYLTQVINIAFDNKIGVFAHNLSKKNMIGINTKIHLAQAEGIMLKRIRDRAMQNGVVMQIPESIYIDYDVTFEGECFIESGVKITGKSHIKESIIKAHSVIENSDIISSDIGPHAHIRPNCKILDSHIGNFVECKNAKLNNIKAGHLSYLGDCEIQDGSNIGAGVITCNYDGINKHKTFIGKNVFVGSDCQLVAPITIKDNVLIGAGSTITKDIPEGSLALSRTKQVNYENGFNKIFKK